MCAPNVSAKHMKTWAQEFHIFQPFVILQFSSVLNKKNSGPTDFNLEQREVFLNNIGHSIVAQNFNYQNLH